MGVIVELQCPADPPATRNVYGGRQRREPTPRSPVRVVLVLDVSHSMAEPHGSTVDNTANSQVRRPASSVRLGPTVRKLDTKRRLADLDSTNQRSAQLRSISVPYIRAFWRENNNNIEIL